MLAQLALFYTPRVLDLEKNLHVLRSGLECECGWLCDDDDDNLLIYINPIGVINHIASGCSSYMQT